MIENGNLRFNHKTPHIRPQFINLEKIKSKEFNLNDIEVQDNFKIFYGDNTESKKKNIKFDKQIVKIDQHQPSSLNHDDQNPSIYGRRRNNTLEPQR